MKNVHLLTHTHTHTVQTARCVMTWQVARGGGGPATLRTLALTGGLLEARHCPQLFVPFVPGTVSGSVAVPHNWLLCWLYKFLIISN